MGESKEKQMLDYTARRGVERRLVPYVQTPAWKMVVGTIVVGTLATLAIFGVLYALFAMMDRLGF